MALAPLSELDLNLSGRFFLRVRNRAMFFRSGPQSYNAPRHRPEGRPLIASVAQQFLLCAAAAMKVYGFVTLLLLLCGACSAEPVVRYEPALVTLQGWLVTAYGEEVDGRDVAVPAFQLAGKCSTAIHNNPCDGNSGTNREQRSDSRSGPGASERLRDRR